MNFDFLDFVATSCLSREKAQLYKDIYIHIIKLLYCAQCNSFDRIYINKEETVISIISPNIEDLSNIEDDILIPIFDFLAKNLNDEFISYIDEYNFIVFDRDTNAIFFKCVFLIEKKIDHELEKRFFLMKKEALNSSIDQFESLQLSPISIITGGPGTGKTHMIASFINQIIKNYSDKTICVAAPTGRATNVIKKATYEIFDDLHQKNNERVVFGTIHKIFNINNHELLNNKEVIKPIYYDFVIIDESSMLSNKMFLKILVTTAVDSKIIFIGDEKQLTAISFGNPFHKICGDNRINIIKLEKNFRTDNQNIIDIATDVHNGIVPIDIKNLNYNEIIRYLISKVNVHKWIIYDGNVIESKIEIALNEIEKFKILINANKGILGSEEINNKILNVVKHECTNNSGAIGYMIPMIVSENQNIFDLVNGSHVIVSVCKHTKEKKCSFLFKDKITHISPKLISSLKLNWATTIHKSQGSSYDSVICVITDTKGWTKSHIYTAVTRAKYNLELLTENSSAISRILNKNQNIKAQILQ